MDNCTKCGQPKNYVVGAFYLCGCDPKTETTSALTGQWWEGKQYVFDGWQDISSRYKLRNNFDAYFKLPSCALTDNLYWFAFHLTAEWEIIDVNAYSIGTVKHPDFVELEPIGPLTDDEIRGFMEHK